MLDPISGNPLRIAGESDSATMATCRVGRENAWQAVTGANVPARHGGAAALDTRRKRIVLFERSAGSAQRSTGSPICGSGTARGGRRSNSQSEAVAGCQPPLFCRGTRHLDAHGRATPAFSPEREAMSLSARTGLAVDRLAVGRNTLVSHHEWRNAADSAPDGVV